MLGIDSDLLACAPVLWALESATRSELVTWNKRRFDGKTNLSVCAPAEWLRQHGYE